MRHHQPQSDSTQLLTARQAADLLLEAATLQAWRTSGLAGLPPVRQGEQVMFRTQDVAGYVGVQLARAA